MSIRRLLWKLSIKKCLQSTVLTCFRVCFTLLFDNSFFFNFSSESLQMKNKNSYNVQFSCRWWRLHQHKSATPFQAHTVFITSLEKLWKFWIKDWVKLLKYLVYSLTESEPKMKDKRHPELFQKISNWKTSYTGFYYIF